MITYVPTSGSSVASHLSGALWSLTRPPQVRALNEITTLMFGHITCLDKSVWLQVDTEFDILIHPEAELDGIADALQPWIDDGALPSNTNEKLASYIEDMRGQSLVVWNAFPQFFKDQSKTYEELVSLNLLSNPRI